jgi:hypothetical protein
MPVRPDILDDIEAGAHEAEQLLIEYQDARIHGGGGVHRDPESVLRDLEAELADLCAASREARGPVER